MKKIIGFIDYFPNESGFLTPIYSTTEDEYYLEKHIDEQLSKVFLDDNFKDYINYVVNFKKVKNKELSIITLKSNISISDLSQRIFAFKFNKNFIIVGNRESVCSGILAGIGTMDNRLVIYNEIIKFISRANINIELKLKELLNVYNIKKYYNYIEQEFISIYDSKNKIMFKEMDSIYDRKLILSCSEVADASLEKIAFRNFDKDSVDKKSSKKSYKDIFSNEISRIFNFVKIYNQKEEKQINIKKYT